MRNQFAVVLCLFSLMIWAPVAALAQSTSTPKGPSFEIADVHTSPRGISTAKKAPTFRSGRYEAQRNTMMDLISSAYSIDAAKVAGGPSWLDLDRFNIIAKAPPDTKPDVLNLMLQALLADRFQLAVHMDNRPQPAYALTLGKGKLQLKQSDGSAPGCRPVPQTQPTTLVVQETACQNITMERFAATLTSLALSRGIPGNYLEGPVVDFTGLTGTWDVDIKFSPPSARAATGEGDTIFEAVEKLGLKLERRDTPASVLAVDRVNQQPTPTPKDVAAALAPEKPVGFELATIRPVAPGTNAFGNNSISQSGLVSLRSRTLRELITLAWDTSNDAVIGLPKFGESDRFDVTAQVPASVARPLNIEVIRPMLRVLLADRFGLKVHEAEQPVDVYVLDAPKSEVKMDRGNNSERGSCKSTPEKLKANVGLSAAITCTNTTMAELADRARTMAPAYVDHAVIDETGLSGGWDFVVMWTGLSNVNGRVNAGAPGDKADALSPVGSLTFFEAIEKLGLKLTLQKRPMPVLVIDHVEQNPTEN